MQKPGLYNLTESKAGSRASAPDRAPVGGRGDILKGRSRGNQRPTTRALKKVKMEVN